MQSIFSWALRVHEKIFIFSGIVWAFSFGFCTCKFTCDVSFNELKQASVVKLTVKLQKSNNATNLCSSFIQFSWHFPNQLTTNNCAFIVSKKQSWHRWAETSCPKKNQFFQVFSSVWTKFFKIKHVYFMVDKLLYSGSPDVITKFSHLTALWTFVMLYCWIFVTLLVFWILSINWSSFGECST